jgi:hypothetical protein
MNIFSALLSLISVFRTAGTAWVIDWRPSSQIFPLLTFSDRKQCFHYSHSWHCFAVVK